MRDLAELPPVYELSPLFSAEQVIEAFLKEVERPGLFALVDLRSKAMWRAGRWWPGVVDAIIRSAK